MSEDDFSISDGPNGETTVVSVAGEIDMETGPAFKRGLLHALGAARGGLIVDLSQATFLDSGALTSLVNAFDDLRTQGGGNLVIVAADPRMRALFDVARLERDFQIFASRADALASLASAEAAETA